MNVGANLKKRDVMKCDAIIQLKLVLVFNASISISTLIMNQVLREGNISVAQLNCVEHCTNLLPSPKLFFNGGEINKMSNQAVYIPLRIKFH